MVILWDAECRFGYVGSRTPVKQGVPQEQQPLLLGAGVAADATLILAPGLADVPPAC